MKLKPAPLICAATVLDARRYAERHRLRSWRWARTPSDFAWAKVGGIILLPGWMCHHLADYAAEAFAATKPPSGTDIAKAAVHR